MQPVAHGLLITETNRCHGSCRLYYVCTDSVDVRIPEVKIYLLGMDEAQLWSGPDEPHQHSWELPQLLDGSLRRSGRRNSWLFYYISCL